MKLRLILIGFFISAAAICFVTRLVQIQLTNDKNYYKDQTLREENKKAKYGRILDRNGSELWHNMDGEDIYHNAHLEGLSAILKGVKNKRINKLSGQNAKYEKTWDPKRKMFVDERVIETLIDGEDVYLSVDIRIQEIVENAIKEFVPKFGAAGASVLVMDPRNGQILAITSFNPDNKKYESTLHSFEPGSIFKPITAVIALENGIDPNKALNVEKGEWKTAENAKIIRDTHPMETNNMQEAMVYSSNIAFGKYVVEEIGYNNFYYGVRNFAINEKSSDFPLGIVHKGFRRVPDVRTQATQGFGQSLDATSLDIAKAFSAIANGGILYNPKIELMYGKDSSAFERDSVRRVISSTEHTRLLRDMLKAVVEKGGTAENVKSKYDFFEFAGKTGTAQMIDVSGKYTNELYNSSFIGMERASDPHFVCLVTMYNTKRAGATVAGPVFQKIMEQIYLHPDLSPEAFAREYAPANKECRDASFIGYSKNAALDKALGLGCSVRFDDENKSGSIVAQTIKRDSTGEYFELSLREHQRNTGLMPDVMGLTLKDALGMLEHVKVTFEGAGKVYMQVPNPGEIAAQKSSVHIKLKENI